MGGAITVTSTVGEGSIFSFTARFTRAPAKSPPGMAGIQKKGKDITPLPSLRILVVEDNAVNTKVAMHLLKKLGLKASAAANGREAMATLAEHPFDLVFMDVQMPEMDGYEVTRAIRSGKAGERNLTIPIVALTASALKADREECFAAGMNDYIVKPVYLNNLAEVIRRLPPVNKSPQPVLNIKEAVGRLGGDEGIFKEVAKMFLDQMPAYLLKLNDARTQGDYEALVMLAHTLKSSAATVGAMTLQSVFITLENASREKNADTVAQLIVQTEKEFARYRDAAAQSITGKK
jgi:CheY-like chemotaxis protein